MNLRPRLFFATAVLAACTLSALPPMSAAQTLEPPAAKPASSQPDPCSAFGPAPAAKPAAQQKAAVAAADQVMAKPAAQTPAQSAAKSAAKPTATKDKIITPAQAKELFASVDQIMQFDSKDTGLPIRHPVKRQLTTRAAVEKYLDSKMRNGKDERRMQRSAVELKKFGLLPRDFDLGPFLVKLLKEQIAGYYDSKTKTVYLLDWIDPGEQKPVLAHELTHALQDQYISQTHASLSKWSSVSLNGISHNVAEDNRHIQLDEADTAREAVLEGQAMVAFIDYALAPHGASIAMNPDFILSHIDEMTADTSGSPVMASAPRVLRESLIFPYREGLKFEISLLRDEGKQGAFEDALNHPPSSSYQIMNPAAYEHHAKVPVLTMPDIHPLIRAHYKPYDVGVMGELDVRMLMQLAASDAEASRLASQWDGGIYYVAQKKHSSTPVTTADVAMVYLSRWKTPGAAALFAKNYEQELRKLYPGAQRQLAADASGARIYTTTEGPMMIVPEGREVYVSESFPLPLARKIEGLMLAANPTVAGGEVAALHPARHAYPDLTGGLRQLLPADAVMGMELPAAQAIAKQLARHAASSRQH
uniref:Lipoprotein n=1 Tax=Acidobacterium capsulatum TaxID=33075 RepID=A0A7V4XQS4_9BACT